MIRGMSNASILRGHFQKIPGRFLASSIEIRARASRASRKSVIGGRGGGGGAAAAASRKYIKYLERDNISTHNHGRRGKAIRDLTGVRRVIPYLFSLFN